MGNVQPPEPASVATADTKALVRAVVGTGIGIGTLLLMLAALMFQQTANVNARFDDVHRRIDDVNARFDALQTDIRELRAEVRTDIRELRDIVVNALKGSDSAD